METADCGDTNPRVSIVSLPLGVNTRNKDSPEVRQNYYIQPDSSPDRQRQPGAASKTSIIWIQT